MKTLITTGFFLIIFLTSCKSKKETTSTEAETETVAIATDESSSEEETVEKREDQLVIDPMFNAVDKDKGTFNIENARIEGNHLILLVSYSGGCEKHDFRLLFNGNYMKSMPPKAELFLLHDANGDACRSLIKEEITVDISALKANNDKVVIILDGYKEQLSF